MAPTSQQTLAKQLASESDQLSLISCNKFKQKIASEFILTLFGTTFDTSCHNSETDSEDKFLKFNHYVTTFNANFCRLCTNFIIVQHSRNDLANIYRILLLIYQLNKPRPIWKKSSDHYCPELQNSN